MAKRIALHRPNGKKNYLLRGRPPRYPWDVMEVGDWFQFPAGVSRNAVASGASKAAKRMDCMFVTRKYGQSYRCWRVS